MIDFSGRSFQRVVAAMMSPVMSGHVTDGASGRRGTPSVGDRLRWLAKLAFSGCVLVFLLHRVEVQGVVDALEGVKPGFLLLALGLYVAGQLVSARKWEMLARALGFRRSYREYATFYFIGMFVNLLGPSTVGGDLARSLFLGGSGRRALALTSVLFDRASGLVVLVVLGLSALLVFPQYELPQVLVVVTTGMVVLLLLSWWVLPRLVALVLPSGHRLRLVVERDLGPFWRDGALLGRVGLVSAGFHLIEMTVQYVLARALGLEVPFSYCLIFHPAVSVLAAIPISVAGLGVREGGYVFFLDLIGVEEATALTFGLLWFAISVVGALPGGLLLMLRNGRGREIVAGGVGDGP
jgi:uncharacterized membrane protein YbhN (UPF0104 family)